MIDNTTMQRNGHAPAPPAVPSGIRAERRRVIEEIRALRRLLNKRRAIEVANRGSLNHEARNRSRAEATHGRTLRRKSIQHTDGVRAKGVVRHHRPHEEQQ